MALIKTKNKRSFKHKAGRLAKKVVLGTAIVGTLGISYVKIDKYRRQVRMEQAISKLPDDRFKKFMSNLMDKEGAYAPRFWIGENTSYGITETTHGDYANRHPEKAMAENVKDMKADVAIDIYKNDYYKEPKISDIENDAIAEMLFDITVNHSPKTRSRFINKGFEAVYGNEADTTQTNSFAIPVEQINSLNTEQEEVFYNRIVQSRIDFFNRPGYIKRYQGLHKRAQSFAGQYKPSRTINWDKALQMTGKKDYSH